MFVDLLPLVVVFGRFEPIRSGDGLRGLVRLEPRVQDLFTRGERRVAGSLVAEHQVVMRLEIFRVDAQDLLKRHNRSVEPPLQELNPADLTEHDPVAGVLRGSDAEVGECLVVPTERFQGDSEEEFRLRETRRDGQRLLEIRDRGGDVAFLNLRPRNVDRTIGVGRVHRRHADERRLGAFEVALQQQPDAVVVPAFAHRRVKKRLDVGKRRVLSDDLERRLRARHDRDRDVGNRLDLSGNLGGITGEQPTAIIVRSRDGWIELRPVTYARERPLRVPPRELAVIHLGPKENSIAGIFGHLQTVMDGVGGARRNEPHVSNGAGHPSVALVDEVAVLVELNAAKEMRAWIHRPFAFVSDGAAVRQHASLIVDRFELDPDIEGIDRATRKEMTDLSRSDDDLDANRLAAAHGDGEPVERREHFGRRRGRRAAGNAELHRFFAHREGA